MVEVWTGVTTILLLIVVFLVYKICVLCKEKSIFEAVKWVVYYDSFRHERPEVRMRDRIFSIEFELALDPKYQITKDEIDAMNEILLQFRQKVIQDYFYGSYQKVGFSFEGNLRYYLAEHEDERKYLDNVTYHKMYYILQLQYLKLSNIVDENNIYAITAKTTKETMDNIIDRRKEQI